MFCVPDNLCSYIKTWWIEGREYRIMKTKFHTITRVYNMNLEYYKFGKCIRKENSKWK